MGLEANWRLLGQGAHAANGRAPAQAAMCAMLGRRPVRRLRPEPVVAHPAGQVATRSSTISEGEGSSLICGLKVQKLIEMFRQVMSPN